ncbi:MAG: serine hydrolase domain-containing protein [Sphingosinicella sp.]
MRTSLIASVFAFAALPLTTASAAVLPVQVEAIAQCAATLAARDEFAGAVAIAAGGKILLSRAYGGVDASAGTPHNIGSLNKMFTAVAIGQLADAGRLSFDAPVGRHLPDLPAGIGRVTLAQLLAHSSGLADYARIENRAAMAAARTATDLLPIAVADGLRFEPGTRRSYSNSGYVLLGAVIERLGGRTWSEYVAAQVLAPAGMTRTYTTRPSDAATALTRRSMAPGAELSAERRPAPSLGGGYASPAGSAYSTAEDLARFAAALLANRLTRPETTARLLTMNGAAGPANRRGETAGYGFGFNLWDTQGTRFAGHGGGSLGVNAELSFNPADGSIVAAVSHYDPPSASQVAAFGRRLLAGSAPVDPALCGTLVEPPPMMRAPQVQRPSPGLAQ